MERPPAPTDLPTTSMKINQTWRVAATIAADLLCWLRPLCLDRSLADVEPKTPRYRILHTTVLSGAHPTDC